MSATETASRLRVSPDALSVVVSAYAAMTEALGPLWTCQISDGKVMSETGDPSRPILHRLTVTWTDHPRLSRVVVRWRAEVES